MNRSVAIESKKHGQLHARPNYAIFADLEKKYGGSLGDLFLRHKAGRISLAVCEDLLHAALVKDGMSRAEVRELIEELGLYVVDALVSEIFGYLFREPDAEKPLGEAEGEEPPLGGGASEANSENSSG